MTDKKNQLIVSIIGVLTLLLITVGVTYAVFTYTKTGTTENTITAGTLKFLYTENTGVGAGIKLENALPVSDTVGKAYSTDGKVFDFSITATNTSQTAMPFQVTLRKDNSSTLSESVVKVYLTDMTEEADTQLLTPTLYNKLTQSSYGTGVEKVLYASNVPAGSSNYTKKFRLRIWIDQSADFSGVEQSDGSMVYPYNGKSFIATVNVYSNL